MRALSNNVSRFVRGADSTLYRVMEPQVFAAANSADKPLTDVAAIALDVPTWSDLDNSSARTFISPAGH